VTESPFKRKLLLWFWNFWPPFLGAGIRIERASIDLMEIDVSMKLHWWNRNYVSTHYGGSLYSMTDPFYMVMLYEHMGKDHIVWDKAANIRFKKPGRGKVRCEFRLTKELLAGYRKALETEEKIEPLIVATILDEENEIVAEVEKLLYIRRKDSIPKKV